AARCLPLQEWSGLYQSRDGTDGGCLPNHPIWPGQDMTTPWAVPPKCEGTCFTHLNGVSIAQAQPAAKCGNVRSEPQNSYQRNWSLTGTSTPLNVVNSFGVPLSMPSALAPLSQPM